MTEQVNSEVNALVNSISDRVDSFHVEAYRLALHGIEIRGIEEERTLYNLFNVLTRSLTELSLAVSFTVTVLRTFGYTNLSELSRYGQPDFNMASYYPKVDLLLTVTAFFYKLHPVRERPNALTFVSSVYMDGFNYKSVSIPQFVKAMSDKEIIKVGDVAALDKIARQYRPSFFEDYLKRSKEQEPVKPTDIVQSRKERPRPTLPQLLKVLKPMKSRWEALADQLDVERPGAGVDELTSLGTVLREWMKKKGDDGVTWSEIEEAVEEMEETEVIRKIKSLEF